MSLATDILKSMNKQAPPKPEKKPRAPRNDGTVAAPKRGKTKPQAPREFGRTRAPTPTKLPRKDIDPVPGVSFHKSSGGWEAYIRNGKDQIPLGTFNTLDRAIIALRLFKLWRRRGFKDIPNKTSRRLYTNW